MTTDQIDAIAEIADTFHTARPTPVRPRLGRADETGPADGVPRFRIRAAPALLLWGDGEAQWSGV